MKPKTNEELIQENEILRNLVQTRQKEWEIENRVIRLLIAAELVTTEKVEEARSLATSYIVYFANSQDHG
jgi:hypothetical protein